MLEYIVLGAIQGIFEWLPISSEGVIVLARETFFAGNTFASTIHLALFLHLGTVMASVVYFRKDIARLFISIFKIKNAPTEDRRIISFLLVSTIISGTIGLAIGYSLEYVEVFIRTYSWLVTLLIGTLLLITGILLMAQKYVMSARQMADIGAKDGVILGLAQGLAALPGLSRSGLTVTALIARKFDKVVALKLSFLMSIPIVIGGNLILNSQDFVLSLESAVALLFSFAFGIITIGALLRIAERVNFGYFVLGFGIITIIAGFV